jgi:predicted PurR-regulated permease PerM
VESGEAAVTKTSGGAGWQRAVVTLTGTVVSVVVIATLYWAQSVFIPVALAVFLTFLLSPFVGWLRQRGLARTPAVILVVLCAAGALGGVGWLVTAQITGLLHELPKYSRNVKEKIRSFKAVAQGPGELQKMMVDINKVLDGRPAPAGPGGEMGRGVAGGAVAGAPAVLAAGGGEEAGRQVPEGAESGLFAPRAAPTAVIVEPQGPAWLSRLTAFLSPLLEYLGELALAIILVVFMLLKREELRNRIIRLAGAGKIVVATKFVDEAGHRVSRFLLLQAIVNGTFGLLFGLGLLLIGVEYALLWGFVGAMLRYLPYIGPYLAVTFPVSLSLAMSEGWGATLMVIGLFLALELVISNFIEPRLYGQSMGVSEIALLVSAAFWAFLWGPIGLVLSSPLTVCLVVLGRYSPRLEFLAVLLGDEPALEAEISFYQRLLARDQDEAEDLVFQRIKESGSPDEIYDTMLLPALGALKRNRVRGDITEDDQQYALQAIREIVEDLGQRPLDASGAGRAGEDAPDAPAAPAAPAIPIFACPAHDAVDRVALEMLQQVLEPARWDVEAIAPGTLTAELLDLVAQRGPAAVCIAAIPPGGLAHTRYLCKRLRARFPDLRILVGRWGAKELAAVSTPAGPVQEAGADRVAAMLEGTGTATDPAAGVTKDKEAGIDRVIAALKEAGADLVAATLLETRQQLGGLLPVLVQGRDGRDDDHRGDGRDGSSDRGPAARGLELAAGVAAS